MFKPDYGYRRRHDPRLAPNWRYNLVQTALSHDRTLHPRRTDTHIKILRDYYEAKQRYSRVIDDDDLLQHELAARYQYVWAADRLFQAGNHHRVRYEVESHLLTTREFDEIAERCSVEPASIEFYEKCFFNIRERLNSRTYIASAVLAPAFMAGLSSRSLEMTAKYFAYFGGRHLLDLVLDADNSSVRREVPLDELHDWIIDEAKNRMYLTTMVGMTYIEPTNFNIRSILEGFQSLLSLTNREQSGRPSSDAYTQALSIFFTRNRPPVGDDADKLPSRPGPIYGKGAVEPRVDEVPLTLIGQTPASLVTYQDAKWTTPTQARIADGKKN